MDHEQPAKPGATPPGNEPDGELVHNREVDEFFNRLNYDMRRPKPGQDAVTAALHAIQKLAFEADTEDSVSDAVEPTTMAAPICQSCGAQNRPGNRFCGNCGVPMAPPGVTSAGLTPGAITPAGMPGEAKNVFDAVGVDSFASRLPLTSPREAGPHFYHHHYHHHYFSPAGAGAQSAGAGSQASSGTAATGSLVGGPGIIGQGGAAASSRAETAVRKLAHDWAQACNTKNLDDLIELYTADAVVLRSNVPAVRGTAAIREFFFTALDAGLGDVELDPLRVELFGDVAYAMGRTKMLVPAAMGKRREERGKFLALLLRQNGEWRMAADCWSSDLSLGAAEPAALR